MSVILLGVADAIDKLKGNLELHPGSVKYAFQANRHFAVGIGQVATPPSTIRLCYSKINPRPFQVRQRRMELANVYPGLIWGCLQNLTQI